ncbi:hypothetical protein Csa_023733 [Cucumis sativus]|nr:hypothetical protein Csa_023733 [Cucumis sativus]
MSHSKSHRDQNAPARPRSPGRTLLHFASPSISRSRSRIVLPFQSHAVQFPSVVRAACFTRAEVDRVHFRQLRASVASPRVSCR